LLLLLLLLPPPPPVVSLLASSFPFLVLAKVVIVAVVFSRPKRGLLQLQLARVVLVEASLFFNGDARRFSRGEREGKV
jgi:hypothetical protein